MFGSSLDHRVWLAAVVVLLGAAIGAHGGDDIDYQEARRLVQEGRILPLAEILDRARRAVPGELIKVELELENGAYVYELKILRPDGRVQEVEIDAATANILKIEDDD